MKFNQLKTNILSNVLFNFFSNSFSRLEGCFFFMGERLIPVLNLTFLNIEIERILDYLRNAKASLQLTFLVRIFYAGPLPAFVQRISKFTFGFALFGGSLDWASRFILSPALSTETVSSTQP